MQPDRTKATDQATPRASATPGPAAGRGGAKTEPAAFANVQAFERRHTRQTERDAEIIGAFAGIVEPLAARTFPAEREWIGATLERLLDNYCARQIELDRLYRAAEIAAGG